jgi:uroporphyrinogen-III synthase
MPDGSAATGVLLIVRPQPEADDFAAALEGLGVAAIPCPVTAIRERPLPSDLPRPDLVLLTSPRAVSAAVRVGAPVIAVGKGTERAACSAGLAVAARGAGEVGPELARCVESGTKVLHLRGEHLSSDPRPFFEAVGASLTELVVYEAEELPRLPVEAAQTLDEGRAAGAVFLSARNLEIFAEHVRPLRTRLGTAFCFSARIADEARRQRLFDNVLQSDSHDRQGFVDFISARCT